MSIDPCDLVIWVHLIEWNRQNLFADIPNLGETLFASKINEKNTIDKSISRNIARRSRNKIGRGPPGTQAPPGQVPGGTRQEATIKKATTIMFRNSIYKYSAVACRNILQPTQGNITSENITYKYNMK